jgi:dTDP-4-dehydrorhamnose 3,5-epimerase-like enzyme
MTKILDVNLIKIPKIRDPRGNLSFIEKDIIPFEVKRVYYLYDIPSDSSRGGHAHKKLYQFLIALSGSFDVLVDDGKNKKIVTLNKPDKGLLIVPGIWRELNNFSAGSVCLVIASDVFNESDYIRGYSSFIKYKNQTS